MSEVIVPISIEPFCSGLLQVGLPLLLESSLDSKCERFWSCERAAEFFSSDYACPWILLSPSRVVTTVSWNFHVDLRDIQLLVFLVWWICCLSWQRYKFRRLCWQLCERLKISWRLCDKLRSPEPFQPEIECSGCSKDSCDDVLACEATLQLSFRNWQSLSVSFL